MMMLTARQLPIHRDIQLQDVNSRFTEQSQIRRFGVLRNQTAHLIKIHPASLSDPENLRLREHEKDELAHYAKRTADIARRCQFDLRFGIRQQHRPATSRYPGV